MPQRERVRKIPMNGRNNIAAVGELAMMCWGGGGEVKIENIC